MIRWDYCKIDDSKYGNKPDRKKQQIIAKLAKIPYFATIPVVFTIPEPFATNEPTKIAAATSTMHPDWAMSNWYEMKIPETVADTAKHIESIIVFLKERA